MRVVDAKEKRPLAFLGLSERRTERWWTHRVPGFPMRDVL